MQVGQYRKGHTGKRPGDWYIGVRARCRERRNKPFLALGWIPMSVRAIRRIRKDEEMVIERKLRRDRSFLKEIDL
jgi:hypothetical protein